MVACPFWPGAVLRISAVWAGPFVGHLGRSGAKRQYLGPQSTSGALVFSATDIKHTFERLQTKPGRHKRAESPDIAHFYLLYVPAYPLGSDWQAPTRANTGAPRGPGPSPRGPNDPPDHQGAKAGTATQPEYKRPVAPKWCASEPPCATPSSALRGPGLVARGNLGPGGSIWWGWHAGMTFRSDLKND